MADPLIQIPKTKRRLAKKKTDIKRRQPAHTPTPNTTPEACATNAITHTAASTKQEKPQIAHISIGLCMLKKCAVIVTSIKRTKRKFLEIA